MWRKIVHEGGRNYPLMALCSWPDNFSRAEISMAGRVSYRGGLYRLKSTSNPSITDTQLLHITDTCNDFIFKQIVVRCMQQSIPDKTAIHILQLMSSKVLNLKRLPVVYNQIWIM